jgi:hypothetical protein
MYVCIISTSNQKDNIRYTYMLRLERSTGDNFIYTDSVLYIKTECSLVCLLGQHTAIELCRNQFLSHLFLSHEGFVHTPAKQCNQKNMSEVP